MLRWTHDGRPVSHEELGPQVALALDQLRRGSSKSAAARPPLRPGALLRITAPGRFHGVSGRVVRRGRSRYLVQVSGGRVYVPFELAEPLAGS